VNAWLFTRTKLTILSITNSRQAALASLPARVVSDGVHLIARQAGLGLSPDGRDSSSLGQLLDEYDEMPVQNWAMTDRLRSNLGPQMHDICVAWSPIASLDFQLAIERIAFEYWAKVIAAMPSQYGDNIWNCSCRL